MSDGERDPTGNGRPGGARTTTRRDCLRKLGAAGPASLTAAAGLATGARADGVPLVRTRKRDGTPGQVRRVPAERRRRLRAYRDLDAGALVRAHDPVVGVSVTGREDGDGLALALLVAPGADADPVALPDRIRGVPTTVVEWRFDPEPARVCERRILDFQEPVVGGTAAYGKVDGDPLPDGTVGVVCWDRAGGRCLLTAAHVGSDARTVAPALYQDGEDDDGQHRQQRIGIYAAHSRVGDGGLDVAKYRVADGASAGPLATVGSRHPDVAGCWEFDGLADATAGGTVPVSVAGRSTCYAEGACVGTVRTDLVDYAACVRPAVATDGDSGAAFLDPRGRLVGIFTHYNPGDNLAAAGRPALDRLGARLTPPG